MSENCKYIACECGCDKIYVSATDKTPLKGMCARCRKDVDLTDGVDDLAGCKLVLTR
jgi:hypothetical protein